MIGCGADTSPLIPDAIDPNKPVMGCSGTGSDIVNGSGVSATIGSSICGIEEGYGMSKSRVDVEGTRAEEETGSGGGRYAPYFSCSLLSFSARRSAACSSGVKGM